MKSKTILFLFGMIFLIAILQNISATLTTDGHNKNFTKMDATATWERGEKITMVNTAKLMSVTYNSTSTSITSYLEDSGKSVLWIVKITNHIANFSSYTSNLTSGLNYYIRSDSNGSARTGIYMDAGVSYPYSGTNLNYISAGTEGADDPTSIYEIQNITTCVGDCIIGGSAIFDNITNVTLIFPANNSIFSISNMNFSSSISTTGNMTFFNSSIFIWYSNGSLFNKTVNSTISNFLNATNFSISNFNLGDYFWNDLWCAKNSTGNQLCSWQKFNNSFTIGASLFSNNYSLNSFETKNETFTATFSVLSGSQIALAQLIYNNVNYTISNASLFGTTYIISTTINIPLNNNSFANQTNQFYYTFTYGGGTIQSTQIFYQNSSFINFQLCNSTYATSSLNFTLIDEQFLTAINPATSPVNFQAYFNYWLGTGSIYKNYSYTATNNQTATFFNFCIFPNQNNGMFGNMLSQYSADKFSQRQYYLNNASFANLSSQITLYLLNSTSAVKFTFTTRQAGSFLSNSYVTISKLFIGDGNYHTVSIKKTDNNGQFDEFLDLDQNYRFIIVKDGNLVGSIDKTAICSVQPCTITLDLGSENANLWQPYTNNFAQNIFSNMSFNSTSKIITYNFIDITGLAKYFRLQVDTVFLNNSQNRICDVQSFSSSGTLTCNLTGKTGEFIAHGFISRSPEKIDKVLSVLIEEIKESIGILVIVFSIFIIITMVFAGAVVSQGNPAVILFFFGITVLILKLMTMFPYSWIIVSMIELIVIILMGMVRS